MSQINLDDYSIYPLGKRLLVEVFDPTKNPGSLIELPKSASDPFQQYGRIVRRGPLVEDAPNALEMAKLNPGTLVSFSRHSGVSSNITAKDGSQFFLLTQDEIQSVLVPILPNIAANDEGGDSPQKA